MSVDGLIEQYRWTHDSDSRNELTSRYEPVQPFILKALTRRLSQATFLDIGANIGFYAVVIGDEDSVDVVHAFEPMAAGAANTRLNMHANLAGTGAHVHELALSDTQGPLEFAVRGPLAGGNGALSDSLLDAQDISVATVQRDRLDNVLELAGVDVVIKIDVEGHELSTLRGAVDTLRENTGFLQMEMHPSDSNAEKFALLEDLGWHMFTRAGADHYFTNIDMYHDRGAVADVLEEALAISIEHSLSPRRASRRRVGPGIYLEVSRSKVDRVKGVIQRARAATTMGDRGVRP